MTSGDRPGRGLDVLNDSGDSLEVQLQLKDDVGMAWWNGSSEADWRYWWLAAITVVPADAWKYFRRETPSRRSVKIKHCD